MGTEQTAANLIGETNLTNNSLTYRVLDGFFWMFARSGVQAVSRTIVVIVLARLLTPEDFGLVGAASVFLGLAGFFSEFGMSSAIERHPQLEERHVQTALTVFTLYGLIIGGLIVLSAPLVARFFQMDELIPLLRVLALVFPIQGLGLLPGALLKRALRFRWVAGIRVVSYALGNGIVGIGLALAGFGVWALVGASLTQAVIGITFLLFIQPYPKRPQFERQAFRELMYFGGGFTLGHLLTYVAEQGDNIVVGRWLGASALGLYGRAYQLIVFPVTLLGSSLKVVLLPSMAKVQLDQGRLALTYQRGISFMALIFLPISVAAVVLAPELVLVMLGPQWTGVVLPFQILATGIFFRASYSISDSVAQATGAVYRRAWRHGIYALLTASGALIGQNWGIPGVAVGILTALTMNFILLAHLGLALVSMSWIRFLSAHIPAMLLAATTFAVVWSVSVVLRNLAMPAIAILVVSGAVTGITQLLLVLLMPQLVLGQDGRYMVDTLRKYVAVKFNQFDWVKQTE